MSRCQRILLIEPSQADARWLEIVLTDAGIAYELIQFSSPVQALSTLRSEKDLRLDLIIMDFRLPVLSAQETIAHFRELPQFQTVPIAVAIELEIEAVDCERATYVLRKPITPEQLERMRMTTAVHAAVVSDRRHTARIWKQFVNALRASGSRSCNASESLILESWQRCHDNTVDRYGPPALRRIRPAELAPRYKRNEKLLNAATSRIDTFSISLADTKHVVYLTDNTGVVLYSSGNDEYMKRSGLQPGFDWSERCMGTNGAGTALASNRPVAVIGPEHWHLAFRDAACLAAPVHDESGVIIGAIDLSTYISDCRPEYLDLVIQLARQIEHACFPMPEPPAPLVPPRLTIRRV